MEAIDKKTQQYQKIILDILANKVRDFPLQPELEDQILADLEGNHFQLFRIGGVELPPLSSLLNTTFSNKSRTQKSLSSSH